MAEDADMGDGGALGVSDASCPRYSAVEDAKLLELRAQTLSWHGTLEAYNRWARASAKTERAVPSMQQRCVMFDTSSCPVMLTSPVQNQLSPAEDTCSARSAPSPETDAVSAASGAARMCFRARSA